MFNIVISMPMNGKDPDDIREEMSKLYLEYMSRHPEISDKPYQLLDTCHDQWRTTQEIRNKAVWLLGGVLETEFARADLVLFGPGWQDARGCRIEHTICEEYGIDYDEIEN